MYPPLFLEGAMMILLPQYLLEFSSVPLIWCSMFVPAGQSGCLLASAVNQSHPKFELQMMQT